MRKLLLMLSLLTGLAAAQTVTFGADMNPVYRQGESGSAAFSLQLQDPHGVVEQGVWFLNVVEALGGGEVRQVSQLLFAAAEDAGNGFRRVFSNEELSAGVATVLDFRFRTNAPPGDYLIALQLYSGRTTNPSRVRPADRVAMHFVRFTLEPAD